MSALVLHVQDALRVMRNTYGIDIESHPGMVKLAGRHYGHIAPHMTISTDFDKSPTSDLTLLIPHENMHTSRFDISHHESVTDFSRILQNHMVPGRTITKSGNLLDTLEYPVEGRVGPFWYGPSGHMDREDNYDSPYYKNRNFKPEFTDVHKLLSHMNKLPRAEGRQTNSYSKEGNRDIPKEELTTHNFRDALEHHRRFHTNMDMPEGTEHMLAVHHIHEHTPRNYSSNRYLYDFKSEKLVEMPPTKAEVY